MLPSYRPRGSLSTLDGSENSDPGSRLNGLARERRIPRIVSRDRSGFTPVHLDHIAGEQLLIGGVGHGVTGLSGKPLRIEA